MYDTVIDLESLLQRITVLGNDYILDGSVTRREAAFEDGLREVIDACSKIDPVGRLLPSSTHVQQFLLLCRQTLTVRSSNSIRSKVQLALRNLCAFNPRIRRCLATDLEIIGPVVKCLLASVDEQLGPQNLIDILRVLQQLTYEKSIPIDDWISALLRFLVKQVLLPETEWFPSCLVILCNLTCHSKYVCNKLTKSPDYNQLVQILRGTLENSSRTAVLCSLIILGYINEPMREILFRQKSLESVFSCVFNVALCGELPITRCIALDFCKRLIISDSVNQSVAPSLAVTAQNVTRFPLFEKFIVELASKTAVTDLAYEESYKRLELLTNLCKVPELRDSVTSIILHIDSASGDRVIPPLQGFLRHAMFPFDALTPPEAPILAAELLSHILGQAVENNLPISRFLPIETLVNLIKADIKTPIETTSPIVGYQCRRITAGLRLAETVALDEEVRKELLQSVTAPLCAHVFESQLLSNPVVGYITKPPAARIDDELPAWSAYGVTIPLELLKLLAALKDFDRACKELYWRSLRDTRLVRFVAYAIAEGDNATVLDALTLFHHCTQLPDFDTKLLSDLIHGCTIAKQRKMVAIAKAARRASAAVDNPDVSMISANNIPSSRHVFSENSSFALNSASTSQDLEESIRQIKNSTNDPKLSQLVGLYENKISILESRAKMFEKMAADREKEFIDAQKIYSKSSNMGGTNAIETKLHSFISDLERKLAEAEAENAALESEKSDLVRELASTKLGFENSKAVAETTIDRLNTDLKSLEAEREKDRTKFNGLLMDNLKEIENLRQQVSSLKSENENRQGEIKDLNKKLEKVEDMKRTIAQLMNTG